MSGVLVFFVADAVDDDIAAALRRRVGELRPGCGFIDDPGAPDAATRTTGGYVRDPGAADVARLWSVVVDASRELGVTIELQWREAILGHVRGGAPDPGVRDAVFAVAEA